jgi:hypothetical protein
VEHNALLALRRRWLWGVSSMRSHDDKDSLSRTATSRTATNDLMAYVVVHAAPGSTSTAGVNHSPAPSDSYLLRIALLDVVLAAF